MPNAVAMRKSDTLSDTPVYSSEDAGTDTGLDTGTDTGLDTGHAPTPTKADARALLGLYVAARASLAALDKLYRAAKMGGRTAPITLANLPECVATINTLRAAIEQVPLSVTAPGGLNRADIWAALFGFETAKSVRTRCDAAAEHYGLSK